ARWPCSCSQSVRRLPCVSACPDVYRSPLLDQAVALERGVGAQLLHGVTVLLHRVRCGILVIGQVGGDGSLDRDLVVSGSTSTAGEGLASSGHRPEASQRAVTERASSQKIWPVFR